MDKIKPVLNSWLGELERFEFPDYSKFPDIDLYMDQVITYLDKELSVLKTSSLDKVITPSMINNYVKGQVVSAPISKKYNREHLALINETCTLKQVLSISEIKQILDLEYEDGNNEEVFDSFKKLSSAEFDKAIKKTKADLEEISDENDVKSMSKLALNLAITANAYITIAKRILYYNKKYVDMKEIRAELENEKTKKEKQN